MIPTIPLLTTPIRLPNPRMWNLERKRIAGTATPSELRELDSMCRSLEADQDNEEKNDGR